MKRIAFSPGDSDSAARFLAECSRLASEGRSVSVRIGGGEGGEEVRDESPLDGMAAGGIEASVTFSRLSGIIEVSPADMLLRARGGTPVADVAAAASESMLRFPHWDESLGAVMSVASLLMEAPRSAAAGACGGLREYVLSVELVTGAGQKVRFGSRSVKDVAGYEVIGLLLGSGGRYGMITEATLRLLPARSEALKGAGTAGAVQAPAAGGGIPVLELEKRIQKVFDPAGILRW